MEMPRFTSTLALVDRVLNALSHGHARHSYAQSGEDLIVEFIANAMGLANPSYLDVGAYHAHVFSNTYLFYKRGCRGVLVEPDPDLAREIRRQRPGDTCINSGVGVNGVAGVPFYLMTTRTLNTFSEAEAKRYEAMGTNRIDRILTVPVVTLNNVMDAYFPEFGPTFVSIDVEGLDFDILNSIDFAKHRPAIVCVETLSYSESREESKDARIPRIMADRGYFPYADTYINTIFVDIRRWKGKAG